MSTNIYESEEITVTRFCADKGKLAYQFTPPYANMYAVLNEEELERLVRVLNLELQNERKILNSKSRRIFKGLRKA